VQISHGRETYLPRRRGAVPGADGLTRAPPPRPDSPGDAGPRIRGSVRAARSAVLIGLIVTFLLQLRISLAFIANQHDVGAARRVAVMVASASSSGDQAR
jgi:hypothetical protein